MNMANADRLAEENYIIKKAKLEHAQDPFAAKAWILAAKTLYPKNFSVQFEAYTIEKNAGNFVEAASCLNYIVLTFSVPPAELLKEVGLLTSALRITDESSPLTPEQDFFVKMFQHFSYDVQHKILLMIAGQSEHNIEHCRLILVLMKRFPQAIPTHSPRLIETLLDGIAAKLPQFRDILIDEALPLIQTNPPVLPSILVNRLLTICFEHFLTLIFTKSLVGNSKSSAESTPDPSDDHWRRLFAVLDMCGRILKWEPFLTYDKSLSKEVYWKKVCQIVSAAPPRPSENKQILFCGTIVYMLALNEYIRNVVKVKILDDELDYIMLEGFRDVDLKVAKNRRQSTQQPEAPQIVINPTSDAETPVCFVTTIHCWQLLHSNEILLKDFTAILRIVPASSQAISRFVIDSSFYMNSGDLFKCVRNADPCISQRERNLRTLNITASHPSYDVTELFNYLIKVISDLPACNANAWIPNLSNSTSLTRNLILLPMTKRAIIQYCTKVLVNAFKQKLQSQCMCSDSLLGNLLVLLQLDWPTEQALAEKVFNIIHSHGEFTYLKFSKYIICADFIEQFMSMWYPHGGDLNLVFSVQSPNSMAAGTRRIGTRGADKGVKDDFKQIIRQQIRKCNEDVETLVQQFIVEEHMQLLNNMFEK